MSFHHNSELQKHETKNRKQEQTRSRSIFMRNLTSSPDKIYTRRQNSERAQKKKGAKAAGQEKKQ